MQNRQGMRNTTRQRSFTCVMLDWGLKMGTMLLSYIAFYQVNGTRFHLHAKVCWIFSLVYNMKNRSVCMMYAWIWLGFLGQVQHLVHYFTLRSLTWCDPWKIHMTRCKSNGLNSDDRKRECARMSYINKHLLSFSNSW